MIRRLGRRTLGWAALTAFLWVGCGGNNGGGVGPDIPVIGDSGTTFTDNRDGKGYKYVTIGTQTWMAENLNYSGTGGSTVGLCHGDNSSNCDTYGRLYTWAEVMGFALSCNSRSCASQVQTPHHQGICPDGWHVPNDAEWATLVDFVGRSDAGTKLKARSGWNNDGNGTDDYGFSALPGGQGIGGRFSDAGFRGSWWGATEPDLVSDASIRAMRWEYSGVNWYRVRKTNQFSMRCVQD